jgi:hypothetical protein
LWIPEADFRRNICEAVSTMYVANKQTTNWYGPFSKPVRPEGWTRDDENAWMDYLQFNYFTYDLWQLIWSLVFVGYWESKVPFWRDSVERIMIHYLYVDRSFHDDEFGCQQQYQQPHSAVIHDDDHE